MDDKTVIAKAEGGISWLKAHERMIIVFMVLLVGCFLGNKWLNADAAKKDAAYEALAQRLEDQKSINDKNAAQTQAQMAQYQVIVETQGRQIAALTGAITARDAALKHKQEQIASMTLPQVAQEWEKALNLPSGALPIQGDTVVVAEPIARSTVSQLAKTTVLEQDLTDEKAIVAGTRAQLDGANGVIGSQVTEIAGLNATLVLQDQTCKAEVAKVKADGRKSKRNWFIAGFIAGIATRVLVKF